MGAIGLPELLIILVFVVAPIVVPFWRIFSRVGLPPALSLLMAIPLVNVVGLYYLAFAKWPALDRHGDSASACQKGASRPA